MKCSFAALALLALAVARPARAVPQAPEPIERESTESPPAAPAATALPPNAEPAEPSASGATRRDSDAELAAELLTEDPSASDLVWLYSNADEYAPSDLTGTPLPAPELPGPGGGSPRAWDPRWHAFSTGNYVLTSVGFGVSLASSLIPAVPDRWRTSNQLDEWGRRNLSPAAYDDARWAQDVSDVLLSFNVAFPLVVDSLIVAYWYRRSPTVAKQIALISAEAFAVTSMLQGTTAGFASRERPYGRDCGDTIPSELDHCKEDRRYRSFFSGHASVSFTMAATTCSHHLRHDLFGSPLADGLTCGVALSSAATVAMMRVVGKQHYLSDVMTGAVVGTLSGVGVPWLLHYGMADTANELSLQVDPSGPGLNLTGVF